MHHAARRHADHGHATFAVVFEFRRVARGRANLDQPIAVIIGEAALAPCWIDNCLDQSTRVGAGSVPWHRSGRSPPRSRAVLPLVACRAAEAVVGRFELTVGVVGVNYAPAVARAHRIEPIASIIFVSRGAAEHVSGLS